MRSRFLIVFLLMFCTTGVDALKSTEEIFFANLSKQSNDIISITSHFTQTKYLKVIDNKLVSEGTFYYQKRGKIRFDYASPKKMSIIMMPDKLQIVAGEKKTTYDLTTQKPLAELAAVMEACISGKIRELPKNYFVEYKLEPDSHLIKIKQSKSTAKNPYTCIELRFNLSSYALEQLTLFEKSEDCTIYKFMNITVNQNLKPSLFMI
ncbi:MAG: outer membrane lipoprotein carrier protein LolA [Bacteroidales bacterium]|jgi:outer membrane lipoprotein-sorting protein